MAKALAAAKASVRSGTSSTSFLPGLESLGIISPRLPPLPRAQNGHRRTREVDVTAGIRKIKKMEWHDGVADPWFLFPPPDARGAHHVDPEARGELLQTSGATAHGTRPPSQPPPKTASTRITDRAVAQCAQRRAAKAAAAVAVGGSPRSAEATALSREHVLRQMHLEHGLGDEQIMGTLGGVRWFRSLDRAQLTTLYQRCTHRLYSRYSTILREGSVGNTFYVLLLGTVEVSGATTGGGDVFGPGASFGERALVEAVRREATIVALEDCYLLQLTAAEISGLPVQLDEVSDIGHTAEICLC